MILFRVAPTIANPLNRTRLFFAIFSTNCGLYINREYQIASNTCNVLVSQKKKGELFKRILYLIRDKEKEKYLERREMCRCGSHVTILSHPSYLKFRVKPYLPPTLGSPYPNNFEFQNSKIGRHTFNLPICFPPFCLSVQSFVYLVCLNSRLSTQSVQICVCSQRLKRGKCISELILN